MCRFADGFVAHRTRWDAYLSLRETDPDTAIKVAADVGSKPLNFRQ